MNSFLHGKPHGSVKKVTPVPERRVKNLKEMENMLLVREDVILAMAIQGGGGLIHCERSTQQRVLRWTALE